MKSSDKIRALAERHHVSVEAVQHLHEALRRSHGGMAQFSHPDLGGHGQWMRGGMTMVGDMFNHELKARVDALCRELSGMIEEEPESAEEPSSFRQGDSWWPAELGRPGSTGGQNQLSYAYFPEKNRVLIRDGEELSTFDTSGFRVSGFSQQQQNDLQGLHLSSDRGLVPVLSLPRVEK